MNNVFGNECIWIPIIVWFVVQTYKVISELIINKKLDIRRFVGAGGMPSSHSALVTSLATAIGFREGFDSSIFALSVLFAFVVMYDSAGVRRAAGKQAKVLNQIIERHEKNINIQEKLIELLGHTPLQVFVGAIVGISLACVLRLLW